MSRIGNTHQRLGENWQQLQRQWHVSEQWQDAKQRQFEREHWAIFQRDIPAFLKELEVLDKTIEQIYRQLPYR